MTEDDHAGLTRRILAGREPAPDCGAAAKDREKVPGRLRQPPAGGLVHAFEIDFETVVGGCVFEIRTLPAPVVEPVARRSEVLEHGEPVRLGERQRSQQHRVEHAEDAGVGADRDGEHGDGEERMRGPLPPEAKRVTAVLADLARELHGHGQREVPERAGPESRERARSCDFDELFTELLLQRGVIVLAEAGRVELQEQAIHAK